MRDWTIRQRILISFAAILGITIIMGGIAYSRLVRVKQGAGFVETNSLYLCTAVEAALSQNYSLTQEYVLLTDAASRQKQLPIIQQNSAVLEDLVRRYEATVDSPEERSAYEPFKPVLASFSTIRNAVIAADANGQSRDALAVKVNTELDPAFEKALDAINNVIDENMASEQESAREITSAASSAETGIIGSFAGALIAALFCGYFLLKAITDPLGHLSGQLERSGQKVNTSVSDIASTAKQQQVMATEVATTTLEIGATSKEISATSKELVRTMDDVSRVAEQSAALAGSGQAGLTQMEQMMRQVIAAAGSVNSKLTVLNEKAGNISQVVTTITKVADQTNLLSLNAAIEAEKAGEYGRGFAVVATEIRRLADQTAVATYDIEQMVKEIQSAVSAGVMSMDKFSEEVRTGMHAIDQIGGQLSQIIQHVQALAPRVESVNEGMQAQTTGAEQISDALTQLSTAAQHTVESLRQSNQAIDELRQASTNLADDVAQFKSRVA